VSTVEKRANAEAMKIEHLEALNVDREVIDIWRRTVGERLLPVQERAVKEFGLLGSRNLIVFSPTSSGKTFVGEMAAVQAARQNRKVFYLVPLKALAEEKYQELRKRYAPVGIRVIVSSRDHHEFDEDLAAMRFGIAVVVYEKLQSFLVSRPALVERTGLVVVDELQLITDPGRGPALELLLTKLITATRRPRLVGLSAVLGRAEALAEWLEADLLVDRVRPVELRKGVLCRGEFRYREHNSGLLGSEPFPDLGEDTPPHEVKLAAVEHLVAQGEQVLVFEKTRASSVGTALQLAERLRLPVVEAGLQALTEHEETIASRHLRAALETSVAFHNADLAPEERALVERLFAAGDVRVVCATPTLAMGMNLPARNVILPADKWVYLDRYRSWSPAPLSKSEYENMSGRAGRYALTEGFGRSLLVTNSPFEAKTWMDVFVDADFEAIVPTLKDTPLAVHLLDLLVSGLATSADEAAKLLMRSFTGQTEWRLELSQDELRSDLAKAIEECRAAGLLEELCEDGGALRLKPTPLGSVCAGTGLSIGTAAALARWLRATEDLTIAPLDVLTALAYTPDGDRCYIPLGKREAANRRYRGRLLHAAQQRGLLDRPVISAIRERRFALDYEAGKRVKKVLLLDAWMDETPSPELEQTFVVWAGAIRRVADELAWLAEALAQVAGALAWSKAHQEELRNLAHRIGKGIQEDLIPIARLEVRGLGRVHLRRLADAGLGDVHSLKQAELEDLELALGSQKLAERLYAHLNDDDEGAGSLVEQPPEQAAPSSQATTASRAAEPTPQYGPRKPAAVRKHSIRFIGTCRNRRYLLLIDGREMWLPNQAYQLLERLAAQRQESSDGWMHISELGFASSPHRALSRLRKFLSPYPSPSDNGWIENDGHGSYRLEPGVAPVWIEDTAEPTAQAT